jgi:hypothetical protein
MIDDGETPHKTLALGLVFQTHLQLSVPLHDYRYSPPEESHETTPMADKMRFGSIPNGI